MYAILAAYRAILILLADPAVYPHFDLYPEAWKATTDSHSVPVGAVAEYPVFNLCKHILSHLLMD
jgi:hypothetical protein